MQSNENLSQILLPRNTKGERTQLKHASKQSFASNHYLIDIEKSTLMIYQYSLDIEPAVPKDSTELLERIINSIHSDLRKQIGYIASKGQMIWGTKDAKIAQTFNAEFEKKDIKYKFEVMVKPVKELLIKEFLKDSAEKIAAVCQVLNINTKNQLKRNLKMVELSTGKFYNQNEQNKNIIKNAGLSVWRGFKVTVVPINFKLYLQVDVCSRILRTEDFLDTLLQFKKKGYDADEINKQFIGQPVVMKYGNKKIFKIEEIDFLQNPESTFTCDRENRKITYTNYYKKNYQLSVSDTKQPLIKVILQKVKVNKNGKEVIEVKKYGYLIPEFVSLTGLTDQQVKNYQVMQSMAEYTKLTAQKRVQESELLMNELRKQQQLMYKIQEKPQSFNGYIMYEPQILIGKNRKMQIKNGSINIRQRIKDPAVIENALFLYSLGRDPNYDQSDADFAIDKLIEASKTFEIIFKEPIVYEVKGRAVADWKNQILKAIQNQGKPSIVILFFTPQEEKGNFYGQLKRFLINEYNIPSQVIRKRTLSAKTKGVMSCASKLVLQMNVKLGHSLWEVSKSHPYWEKKKVAICAFSFSKGKNGNTVAFVGTINNELSNIFCDCKNIRNKDQLSSQFFKDLFTQWFQNYFKQNNKSLPDTIIIYRQGLNDIQAKAQIAIEIDGLEQTFKTVSAKAKIDNYCPKYNYLLVNKKINTRMYVQAGKNGKNREYSNPASGSIIFEELSTDNYSEFYLASVNVTQGTCTPVQFKIGNRNAIIPKDALAELTYDQCFNYPNWSGAVRVPGVLQCANKLAKLFSEHIHENLTTKEKNSDLKTKLFFL